MHKKDVSGSQCILFVSWVCLVLLKRPVFYTKNSAMFALGGSSCDDLSSEQTNIRRAPIKKKQTFSSKVVAARTINKELS